MKRAGCHQPLGHRLPSVALHRLPPARPPPFSLPTTEPPVDFSSSMFKDSASFGP